MPLNVKLCSATLKNATGKSRRRSTVQQVSLSTISRWRLRCSITNCPKEPRNPATDSAIPTQLGRNHHFSGHLGPFTQFGPISITSGKLSAIFGYFGAILAITGHILEHLGSLSGFFLPFFGCFFFGDKMTQYEIKWPKRFKNAATWPEMSPNDSNSVKVVENGRRWPTTARNGNKVAKMDWSGLMGDQTWHTLLHIWGGRGSLTHSPHPRWWVCFLKLKLFYSRKCVCVIGTQPELKGHLCVSFCTTSMCPDFACLQ